MEKQQSAIGRSILRLAFAALFVGAVAFGVMRLSQGDAPNGNTRAQPSVSEFKEVSGLGPLDTRAPLMGEPAPEFALQSLDGSVVRLSDYRGSAVVLNFWATWCGPCKVELPAFDAVNKAKRGQGLTFLAVDYQETAAQTRTFMEEQGLSLPVLLDRQGTVAQTYRVTGLPVTYFIDAEGVVRGVTIGLVTHEDLVKKLALLGVEVPPGVLKDRG